MTSGDLIKRGAVKIATTYVIDRREKARHQPDQLNQPKAENKRLGQTGVARSNVAAGGQCSYLLGLKLQPPQPSHSIAVVPHQIGCKIQATLLCIAQFGRLIRVSLVKNPPGENWKQHYELYLTISKPLSIASPSPHSLSSNTVHTNNHSQHGMFRNPIRDVFRNS